MAILDRLLGSAQQLRPTGPAPVLTPVPWVPVGAALLTACGLLLATSGRYGFHRDELYFRLLPVDWGYVDQPPLTPLLAKASIAVFGDTPAGIRVPAVFLFAAATLLAVLTTRELGGGRPAQALSAWGFGFATIALMNGHLLLTGTLDLVCWAAVLLFVGRALLRDEPRWWLAVGAVVGVSTYNKLLIGMLLISVGVGLLALGPRPVLRSRWLWAGAGIAILIAMPNLVYQATHGFPQLSMAGALSDNNGDEVRAQVLPMQLLLIGPLLAPVWIAGLVALLRLPQWRPVRGIAVAYGVAVLLTLAGGGQIYYAFGVQAFLLACGWVPTVDWARRVRWRTAALVAVTALHAVTGALLTVPVLPLSSLAGTPMAAINPTIGDQIGWPEYVSQIAAVYRALPAEDQARTVVVTANYGEAGAVHRYGDQYGLPPVYSGHNHLYHLGPPPADRTLVLLWSQGHGMLRRFDGCEVGATLDHGYGVENEEQGSVIAVCQLPAAGWTGVWPSLQHND